jgi:hypothetical protein
MKVMGLVPHGISIEIKSGLCVFNGEGGKYH